MQVILCWWWCIWSILLILKVNCFMISHEDTHMAVINMEGMLNQQPLKSGQLKIQAVCVGHYNWHWWLSAWWCVTHTWLMNTWRLGYMCPLSSLKLIKLNEHHLGNILISFFLYVSLYQIFTIKINAFFYM